MSVLEILAALEAAGTLTSAAKAVYEWLRGKHNNGDIESDLQIALNELPHGADVGEIVRALDSFYKAKGGNLLFKAGNDGGGDLVMTGVHAQAGSGPDGGGCIRIAGGNGGPNGKGGTVTISGSKFIGGNAQ